MSAMDQAVKAYFKASHSGMDQGAAISEAVAATRVHRGQLVKELMAKWLELDQGDE